jgi:iron complex outermembrane receptor protein
MKHSTLTGACGLALQGLLTAAHAQSPALPEVTVLGGQLSQKAFDTPATVQHINARAIQEAGPRINLSEALAQVPGVVALNRNNYAQDVQISIRGFGARAAFGLRGIRLITDGIPATTPDGQGQASTVALGSAARMEVLSGPLAQLYGNASGGVIQTFTREAGAQPQLDVSSTWGNYGLQRHDVQLSGRMGPSSQVGVVVDYSLFDTEGYRSNSAASRKHFNSVITSDLSADTRLRVIANVFDMPKAKDPLGLTQAQWQADPSQPGNRALVNDVRKSVQQSQLGLVLEHRIHADLRTMWRVYSGTRQNLQYQAGRAQQPLASGAWVSLDREFTGLGGQLKGGWRHALGRFEWVGGLDLDRSEELRQGGATTSGQITGSLTRQETNVASNTDAYVQLNWHFLDAQGHNPYSFTAGLRRSQVKLSNTDDLPATDGNGSGSVRYAATQPVLGATWHATEALNVYANWGKGLETPTLAEAAYSVENNAIIGKFNTALKASRSTHTEAGLKWRPAPTAEVGAAVFRIKTDNEIVTQLSNTGRTAFVNAARTQREGLEIGWQQRWSPQWRSQLSATWLQASYDSDFTTPSGVVKAGNRMPGIPDKQLFASLQWSERSEKGSTEPAASPVASAPLGWSAALEGVLRSGMWANDLNDADARAGSFALLNLKLRHRSQWGPVRAEAWLGVDNLTDRKTVGSVIVNQAGRQFFESGLPRNEMVGLKLSVPL